MAAERTARRSTLALRVLGSAVVNRTLEGLNDRPTCSATSVVSSLFAIAGGPAIYDNSPLQRRLRDAHTAGAHFQIGSVSREIQGRLLLDQPADATML